MTKSKMVDISFDVLYCTFWTSDRDVIVSSSSLESKNKVDAREVIFRESYRSTEILHRYITYRD